MEKWLVIIFLYCTNISAAQDYRHYHTLVNNAERCFFLERNTDSALCYYDSAFKAFDFVFVKDCYMAAQIAYSQKDKRYIAYMRKGFAHGLQPWHMKLAPVFTTLVKDSLAMMRNFRDYPLLRKKYLAGIKVGVLRNIIRKAAIDLSEIQSMPDKIYADGAKKNVRYVEELIRSVGFPGDKVMGIFQSDIMNELGYPGQDITEYQWGRGMLDNDSCLSQTLVTPMLLNRKCTYLVLRPYWLKLIGNGEIHPRDVAQLHDWMQVQWVRGDKLKDLFDLFDCPPDWVTDGCYAVNMWHDKSANYCNARVTDSLRAKMFIVPLAVDSAKAAIGSGLGFKTNFGSMDAR